MQDLNWEREIGLRKIPSLDSSALYTSLEEKKKVSNQTTKIAIPQYPVSPSFKNSASRRIWYRVRYFNAVLRQKLSRKEYPLIAVVVVNNKCNWNCTYCFGDYPNRRQSDYTTDELKYLIDSLHAQGVRHLIIHGGEALLRPDIGDICSFIKCKGMYLCLVTNGSLLPQKIKSVSCVDNLTLSLDGAKYGNDKNRGDGSFDLTMQAINCAIKEKIPLRVQATLTRYTIKEIDYLAELAKRIPFQLQFSILFKPLKQAQDYQVSMEEIRTAIRLIREYKRKGYPIFTSDQALTAAYEWPFDVNETHHLEQNQVPDRYIKHQIKCFYSRTKFTIEADGYVYPCFLTTDGSFAPLNWKTVGVEPAIENVRSTNRCRACPAFTQNDHNLLLGMNPKQVFHLIKTQLRETLFLS